MIKYLYHKQPILSIDHIATETEDCIMDIMRVLTDSIKINNKDYQVENKAIEKSIRIEIGFEKFCEKIFLEY